MQTDNEKNFNINYFSPIKIFEINYMNRIHSK